MELADAIEKYGEVRVTKVVNSTVKWEIVNGQPVSSTVETITYVVTPRDANAVTGDSVDAAMAALS